MFQLFVGPQSNTRKIFSGRYSGSFKSRAPPLPTPKAPRSSVHFVSLPHPTPPANPVLLAPLFPPTVFVRSVSFLSVPGLGRHFADGQEQQQQQRRRRIFTPSAATRRRERSRRSADDCRGEEKQTDTDVWITSGESNSIGDRRLCWAVDVCESFPRLFWSMRS